MGSLFRHLLGNLGRASHRHQVQLFPLSFRLYAAQPVQCIACAVPARGANAGTYWAHYTTFSTWQEPGRLHISNCCRYGCIDTSINMYNSQATAFTCMSCFLHARTPLKGWSLQRNRLITFSMRPRVKRLPKLLQVQCPSVFKTRLLLNGMKPESPSKA